MNETFVSSQVIVIFFKNEVLLPSVNFHGKVSESLTSQAQLVCRQNRLLES